MIEYENLRDINEPYFNDFTHNFNNVLNTGVFVHGSYVKKFEESFSDFIGAGFCVSCASGSDALLLSLKSFDFEKGSEIIVPSNSHYSTIQAVAYAGLMPVLTEPDINSYNIDPTIIEEKISSKTKAVLAVHLYGKTCNMDALSEIAVKNNLKLIEECSHSHGAKYKNKTAGSFGDMAAFGFDPTKILGALGDAGAVTTGSKELAAKLNLMRNCSAGDESRFDLQGFNSCPNELQNGFLISKLKTINEIIEHKRKLANLYNMFLKDDFIKPAEDDDYFDVYFAYIVRHPQRDKLKEYLLKNGIQTRIHNPIPPYKHKSLKGIISKGEFPLTEKITETSISLPLTTAHQEMEIFKVIETMNKF